MKKRVYVSPLSVVVPIKLENLMGTGVASGVNTGVGEDDDPITPVDPQDPDPPMPGKEWSFDDEGGVGNWNW